MLLRWSYSTCSRSTRIGSRIISSGVSIVSPAIEPASGTVASVRHDDAVVLFLNSYIKVRAEELVVARLLGFALFVVAMASVAVALCFLWAVGDAHKRSFTLISLMAINYLIE